MFRTSLTLAIVLFLLTGCIVADHHGPFVHRDDHFYPARHW